MQIKLFGCKIYISLLFLTMMTLMLLLDKTGFMLFGFVSVIIHECGHLCVMIASKNKPQEIILQPAGILIKKQTSLICSRDELAIASAGCTFNLIFALFGGIIYMISKNEMAVIFSASNLCIMCFNLLIIKGLDGYDIAHNLLCRIMPDKKAALSCRILSLITVFLITFASLYLVLFQNGNMSLLICAVYLVILCLMNIRC